jgi:small-conductance mechanosensitive channel
VGGQQLLLLVCVLIGLSGKVSAAPDNPAGHSTRTFQLAAAQTPSPRGQDAAPSAAAAESDAQSLEAMRDVEKLKAQIQELRRNFEGNALQDRDLNEMREAAERIITRAANILEAAQPRQAELKERLARLSPPPQAGQPPEPEAVTIERNNLNGRLSQVSAPIRGAEDVNWEAGNLLDRINRRRRVLFADKLLQRVASPVSPGFWTDVQEKAKIGYRKLTFMAQVWANTLFDKREFYAAALVSGLIWLLTSMAAFWGVNRFRRWSEPEAPPFWRRASSAGWVVLFTAAPPAATAASFYVLLKILGLVDATIESILRAAVAAVCVVAAVNAIAATLLAPGKPQWRIFLASGKVAARIRWLCVGMAAVFGADLIMGALNEALAAPLTLSIAQNIIASIAFATLGMTLFLLPSNSIEVEGAADLRWLRFLRLPFAAAALAIFVCALAGYAALARFLAAQIVVTGTIVVMLYLTFIAVDAFAESLKDDKAAVSRWLHEQFGLDERARAQAGLPIELLLKIAALAAAVPLVMLQLGFDWGDVRHIVRQAFFGFDVGNITISFASLFAALLVFFIAYTLARIFQGWLDRHILAKAGMSGSARDSIRTGIGYGGVLVACIIAISSAGVNFSNIAIVAGALSVGVGLGLQGVVNNFVSGLILLAERPVRVGDWIEVHGEEGIVRRISVRATELETFDRAHVVIPNSMLISDRVKNWTLHNDMGRVVLPVSVAVGSDPEEVCDILKKAASDHVEVLTSPAPIVYFENVTATSLEFKLFVYLLNLGNSLNVRTELRIAILKAFKEAGVQIPHSQLDIFIRDFHGAALELAKKAAQSAAGIDLKGLDLGKDEKELKN